MPAGGVAGEEDAAGPRAEWAAPVLTDGAWDAKTVAACFERGARPRAPRDRPLPTRVPFQVPPALP